MTSNLLFLLSLFLSPLSLPLSLLVSTLERKSKRLIAQDGWSPPPFDSSCVRLVLYQDHEGRGKKQIFDTKAHQASMSNQDISESNVRECVHIIDTVFTITVLLIAAIQIYVLHVQYMMVEKEIIY